MRQARLAVNVRVVLARHRRLIVAALLAAAVAAGLQALRPPSPATRQVFVAAHDLPTGHLVQPADLTARQWPVADLPDGVLVTPSGRVLAAPLRRGEPVTDARVRGGTGDGADPSGSHGGLPAGLLAITVRLTDPASALVLRPGDHTDVFAGPVLDPVGGNAPSSGGGAGLVIGDALVLATSASTAAGSQAGGSAGAAAGAAADAASGQSGGLTALWGSAGGDAAASTTGGTDTGLPAGVLVLAVDQADALRLAAVQGARALSVARRPAPPAR